MGKTERLMVEARDLRHLCRREQSRSLPQQLETGGWLPSCEPSEQYAGQENTAAEILHLE